MQHLTAWVVLSVLTPPASLPLRTRHPASWSNTSESLLPQMFTSWRQTAGKDKSEDAQGGCVSVSESNKFKQQFLLYTCLYFWGSFWWESRDSTCWGTKGDPFFCVWCQFIAHLNKVGSRTRFIHAQFFPQGVAYRNYEPSEVWIRDSRAHCVRTPKMRGQITYELSWIVTQKKADPVKLCMKVYE